MSPMYLKRNPHSCAKCGGIVRVFCPMDRNSKPCTPIHQTQQTSHPDQSHQHSYQSPVKESLQSH